MKNLKVLLELALDLNASMDTTNRYQRFLQIIRKIIPYDAATLMLLEKETLLPLAGSGLSPKALTQIYPLKEHPRLQIICKSDFPTLFPPDSPLKDPFDGYLVSGENSLKHIHACLGCPLIVENKLVGVLTADALRPHAFDHLEPAFLATLGALAGNAVRLSYLIDKLEKKAKKEQLITQEMMKSASQRNGEQILGEGALTLQLKKEMEIVAKSDFNVLITGETGVGKELVARNIHQKSSRFDKPLIYLNCAALPDSLAESELFGHVKGSFTGAESNRVGKFELADGGTLFLDEIGELSLPIQSKILRTLQEGELQRIGAEQLLKVDVRIVAATNRNLENEISKGNFRADLYHRLNVFPIQVPPLKERMEDIEQLATFFCNKIGKKFGIKQVFINESGIDRLKEYSWPGNIRELKNILSRVILKATTGEFSNDVLMLTSKEIRPELHTFGPETTKINATNKKTKNLNLKDLTEQFKKEMIQKAVAESGGNWTQASHKLGIDRSNLHHLAKKLKLKSNN